MEEPNEEEKIGDGINGGKPLEDNGNGEVIGTVVGDCRGEAEKETFKYRDHPGTSFYSLPGDPENGVKDVGGVVDPPGCAPKNPPPGEAIEGGEAGDEGLPLPVFGGLMRFSFCRLLKNKKSKSLSKSTFLNSKIMDYRLQNQTRTTSFSILRESAT